MKITQTCPKTVSLITSQFDDPDGELAASIRCLSQHYIMPCEEVGGLLTDIGTEELAHLEMICAIIYQLAKNLASEQVKTTGSDVYYVDHIIVLWPVAATGVPFNAYKFQSEGDAIANLHEDLAVEQKVRTTYDSLIQVIESPEVGEPLEFLHTREVVHFQRFGKTPERIKPKLDEKNFYYFSPEFGKQLVQDGK